MEIKLFDKYPYEGVVIQDPSLKKYLSLRPLVLPHTFARHANKPFAKAQVNIVERLANKLMRGGTGEKISGRIIRTHGKLQGKKTKVLKIIEKAFDDIAKVSGKNPLQVLIQALEKVAPREDITRVRFGGVAYQVAVDISAQRRLDLGLHNLAIGAILASFDKKTTLGEALANEIVLAAKNDTNSYALKRKNENERMAKSAR